MARDTVTVPREAWNTIRKRFICSWTQPGLTGDKITKHSCDLCSSEWLPDHQEIHIDGCPLSASSDAPPPSSDPEGGARGVQTSIATKQESCPESAPRTETAVRDWRKSVFTYEHDDAAGHLYYFAPQTTAPGPLLQQRHVQAIVDIASDGTFAGVELIDNMPPLHAAKEIAAEIAQLENFYGKKFLEKSMHESHYRYIELKRRLAQLIKTPSADHDDGNLRGLSAPNHQPHAVSQGWRDIETAPRDGTRIIAVGWDWGIVGNEQHVTTVVWRQDREEWSESADGEDGSACAYLTHWMPLPAPASPAKTGGAE